MLVWDFLGMTTQASNGQHCVILGGGHAAASLCQALCKAGWAGDITLVSAESQPPYHRPPLSKTFLLGETDGQ